MQSKYTHGVVLGLDIGDSRIGLARAHTMARLPEPLGVIEIKNQDAIKSVTNAINNTNATLLVIGLPTLASGSDSTQTKKIREFTDRIAKVSDIPYIFVNEAYSSLDANEYIKRTKSRFATNDSIAACIILERYFESKKN